eukprot:CAMPEP_0167815442 /NCGR_PEP_ID=MMETSP0112_2-20121227/3022_1 /TAXON_ID=91324 /ORGANISM="Lotharella globosa, Strain CCCM811" /LENGTH=302 /DNA_ID=CAMNT_0007714857 /DNA_START=62 /DNA_END=970 /DNA_ORIENTATION=+
MTTPSLARLFLVMGVAIASPTASPTSTSAPATTRSPTLTLSPSQNPTTAHPTSSPTTCSPSSCAPSTTHPTVNPTISPSSASPTVTPLTIAPTTQAPSHAPTVIPTPQGVLHEPDEDGKFWMQTVTNAGEVVWTKLERDNVTAYGPIIYVDTPVHVDTWLYNRSVVINWRVVNIPSSQRVTIELYRDHYHPRHYVRTIVAGTNATTTNGGGSHGTYTWPRVYVDPGYSIDEFYVVRVCWEAQKDICGVSQGVARIEVNRDDPTGQEGGTGLIGTGYEWEKINTMFNHDPAEGTWPNSINENL